MRTMTFGKNLGSDTVMYSTYIDAARVVPGNSLVLGPCFIRLGNTDKVGLRQNNALTVKEETGDVFSFNICRKNICAYAESYFYQKTKTTLVGGKDGGVRVRGEKIYGQIYLDDQPVRNFEVSRMGRLRGYGFFRLSDDETIRIEPIGRKTNYGKKAYGVGLDYTMNGKTIGGFIQRKGEMTVVLKKGLDDNLGLLLTALSLALINRSNEIIIL